MSRKLVPLASILLTFLPSLGELFHLKVPLMASVEVAIDQSTMTPLYGHTSKDTAYLQPDYPYGRQLRCQRRVWIEHDPKKGMRFCTQTTNPKVAGTVWNKPKKSTYSSYICLLLNPENEHIIDYHLQLWTDTGTIAKFQQFWLLFYGRLDTFNQEQLDQLGKWIAKAVNQSKHYHPIAASVPTISPRIEVDVEWFYHQETGLFWEAYANQVGEGNPSQLPIVSAQALHQKGFLYNLLDSHHLTTEVVECARAIAGWSVAEYSQDHWCRAVLKGYRGFEWEGQPINDQVQLLLAFNQRSKVTEADRNAHLQMKQQVWDAAAQYWQHQQPFHTDSIGVTYNISHATCQN